MSTSLMRRKENFDEAANTAFLIRLALASALTLGSIGVGWGASILYSEPRLIIPMILLTASLLIQSVGLVPRVIAGRSLDFPRTLIPDQIGKYGGSLTTLGLAIIGFAYFSPVYGIIAGVSIGSVLQLIFSKWRPRLRFNGELARELISFGQFVTLGTFANLIAHSLDSAIVGLVLGMAPLGIYSFAYSWGVYFTSNISSSLASVSYPVLSRVWDAPDRLRRVFLENVKLYSYLALCLGGGIAVLAPSLVTTLYDPVWQAAVLPMQILSAAGLLIGYSGVAGDALYAQNDPKRVMIYASGEAAIIVVLVPPAVVYGGLLGACLSALAGAIFVATMTMSAICRRLTIGRRALQGTVGRPLGALAGATLATMLVASLVRTSLGGLLMTALVFLLSYVLILQALTSGSFFADIREIIKASAKR